MYCMYRSCCGWLSLSGAYASIAHISRFIHQDTSQVGQPSVWKDRHDVRAAFPVNKSSQGTD